MTRPALHLAIILAAGTALAGAGTAQPLTIPTSDEAKDAVMRMLGDPDLVKSLASGHVKIGTCKKASDAAHPGAVACTIAVVMGAGSSETQANFFRAGGQWMATPTQEDLPFPDPKLQ